MAHLPKAAFRILLADLAWEWEVLHMQAAIKHIKVKKLATVILAAAATRSMEISQVAAA